MINTPYERGWRDAAAGIGCAPCAGDSATRAYRAGYVDAIRNGYAPRATPPERPAAKEAAINGGALHKFMTRLRAAFRAHS